MFNTFHIGKNKPEEMDPELFVPILDNPCLPQKVRTFFRFGVPERKSKLKWKAAKLFGKDEECRLTAFGVDCETVVDENDSQDI